MASISSLGVGSGLDLGSIISGLTEAERAPVENRLNFKEEVATTRLSAFGALKSSLSLFQGSLGNLQLQSTYNTKKVSLSEAGVFSASASSIADVGSYSVEVSALAQAQSLASNAATAFADVNDVIGEGTLTIRFGTTTEPYAFTPDSSKATENIIISAANGNNTLSGFRDYINDNDFGMRAAIIDDGSGFRLTLTSENTGAANSMEISVAGDSDGNNTDNSGLSQLAFNASAQGSMLQTVAAQDAQLSINGLAITRESNTVNGAINGVTLDLLKADIGKVINVNITEDSGSISTAVNEFVEGYNGLAQTINELTKFDSTTGVSGLLIGDFTVRNISSQLRGLMSRALPQLDGNIRSLADIGIITKSDGTLELNSSKLDEAVADYPSEVEALFRPQGRPSDSGVSYVSSLNDTQAGDYSVFVNTVATQGVYNGGSLNNLTIDANNDTFTIRVDGTASGSIQLTQAVYANGEALADHIQAQINADTNLKNAGVSVLVSYDSFNNELDINSNSYGSSSQVEFISVATNTLTDLGFAVGQNGSDGVDVAGTINGSLASGDGQLLTSSSGNSNGLALTIDSTATGSRGTVSFSKGIIGSLNELLDNYLQTGGLISSREDGLKSELKDIGDERIKLETRISDLEARLIKQFSALDALIAQFNNTSNFLTQQLANLPEPNSINREN